MDSTTFEGMSTSKKAITAATFYMGTPSIKMADAASMAGVSKRSVERAVRIIKSGNRSLVKLVNSGDMSIGQACNLLPEEKKSSRGLFTKAEESEIREVMEAAGMSSSALVDYLKRMLV